MMKRIILIVVIVMTLSLTALKIVEANKLKSNLTGQKEIYSEIDPTTNFFTQKENKEKISIVDKSNYLKNGYELISENDYLKLYLKSKTLGIALVDKRNNYTWFSCFEDYNQKEYKLTKKVKEFIESGVTVEYYDASGSAIKENKIAFTNDLRMNKKEIEKFNDGFIAHIHFGKIGLSFDLEVKIEAQNLIVNIPSRSIKEEVAGKLDPKVYQVKAIYLFPYFGSQNYKINGYSFIPDGSGALIRFTDVPSNTGFKKMVYGEDYGIKPVLETNKHLKESGHVSLPIFGINHGYDQNAFLCEILKGDGAAELNSYPYLFDNKPFNSTFFKFKTRDEYAIELTSGKKIHLINELPYQSDYSLKYTFLVNEEASYVGMAKAYKKSLNLEKKLVEKENTPIHLTFLGNDYKPGLFGNNYLNLTSYKDALNIVKDLENDDVKNLNISYLGFNSGGYFKKGSLNGKLSSKLGSKKDFLKLSNYLNNHNHELELVINPMSSDSYGFLNPTVKKINLSTFSHKLPSSREQIYYYNDPKEVDNLVYKEKDFYNSLKVHSFLISDLKKSFSYYDGKNVFRSEMIDNLENSIYNLEKNYQLSASNPNSYLFKYLTNYYDSYYESSKYLYETDSVPFISILLSGNTNLYTSNINFVSDYHLMNLRMMEYNLYPSFILTSKEAYNLRFTNFEYLNSTEYKLWASLIKDSYKEVNDCLKNVYGKEIIDHEYLDLGIAKTTYSNGVSIIVNYTNNDYNLGDKVVLKNNYLVLGGSSL